MHPNQRARALQQSRIQQAAANSDSYAFFNLLTAPAFLEQVEELLPEHRERLFPPTETLSMFIAQTLAADRSCQKAVDDAAIKRLIGGLPTCSTHTGAYCKARQRLPQEMAATLTPLYRYPNKCPYAGDVALERTPGLFSGWRIGHLSGYTGESGRVSTAGQSGTGFGFSTVSYGGVDLSGQWRDTQCRDRAL